MLDAELAEWNDAFDNIGGISGVPGYEGSLETFGKNDVSAIIGGFRHPGPDGYGNEELGLALELKDGRFAWISASCDTTGWD